MVGSLITRRFFLGGAAAGLVAAPAIVRAASLMAVKAAPEADLGRLYELWDRFGISALYDERWPIHVGDIDRKGVAHWRVVDAGMSGLSRT
jgi:hypothetical protein